WAFVCRIVRAWLYEREPPGQYATHVRVCGSTGAGWMNIRRARALLHRLTQAQVEGAMPQHPPHPRPDDPTPMPPRPDPDPPPSPEDEPGSDPDKRPGKMVDRFRAQR